VLVHQADAPVPVVITAYSDKTFTYVSLLPPTTFPLFECHGHTAIFCALAVCAVCPGVAQIGIKRAALLLRPCMMHFNSFVEF